MANLTSTITITITTFRCQTHLIKSPKKWETKTNPIISYLLLNLKQPWPLHSPVFFDMASDKDARVSSQIQDNNWALTLVTPSLVRLQALTTLIHSLREHASWDGPNLITWNTDSSATFTVSAQYQLLQPPQPHDKAAKNYERWRRRSRLR